MSLKAGLDVAALTDRRRANPVASFFADLSLCDCGRKECERSRLSLSSMLRYLRNNAIVLAVNPQPRGPSANSFLFPSV